MPSALFPISNFRCQRSASLDCSLDQVPIGRAKIIHIHTVTFVRQVSDGFESIMYIFHKEIIVLKKSCRSYPWSNSIKNLNSNLSF
ncbi:hypothetical protein EYC80_001705 [Monilinia laxa]|uniref:Uncharacterized protein n=1 Tax=Monilinia laxa TaxID=61186 RepID=A0A5N6K5Y9_MONLA|nr:hypothetical protein EYC80_001705 [Monilinia laxa]